MEAPTETERWDRMWSLFHRALPLPPSEREALLVGAENSSLRQEVERLLASHDEDGEGILFAGQSLSRLLGSAMDAESLVG